MPLLTPAGVCYDQGLSVRAAVSPSRSATSNNNLVAMPIGSYSLCPGGQDKKVKFCCPDLTGELEKIERMLEGEQYAACLQHVQQLEQKHPDRACLAATKTLLLRIAGQLEETEAAAAAFLKKFPDNPLALAESAVIAAARRDSRAAMELLARAIVASGDRLHGRVYDAMGVIARVLVGEGQFQAARAITMLQVSLRREDEQALELLVSLNSSPSIPLVLKDDKPLANCDDAAPWKAQFDETIAAANRSRWAEAAEKLATLAERVQDVPVIWRNLAFLRGWLADTPAAIEAWRKFAALDVPLEDAVEAEATALFLSEDPLDDQLDVLTVKCAVKDSDALEAAFSSASWATQVDANLGPPAGDEGPPPKAIFFLFDGVTSEMAEELTLENVSRVLGQAILFGKQTDRQARLEVVGVLERDLEQVKSLVGELAGDEPDAVFEEEVTGEISRSEELLSRNWRLPEDSSQEQFHQLAVEYVEDALLNQWPELPLGLLDGKSPQEVAPQEDFRVKLLAAIMLIEYWLGQSGSRFDCNRLRSRLGLPTLEPIDAEEISLARLPLVRLSRVMVDKLSDDDVLAGYRRAMFFGVRPALKNFAQVLVDRPRLAEGEEQLRAYNVLARLTEDSDEALQYLDQGRQASKALDRSCASWDLMELRLRFERGEGVEAGRLIDHFQRQHMQEPGVGEALTRLLVEVGVIRPDGTPAVPPGAAAAEEPAIVVPGQAQPGKLWTPDGEEPGGEKGKIWTPDMG